MAKKASKKVSAVEARAKSMPMRFEMPTDVYQELARQARKIGLSNASYAKMLVMKAVAEEKDSQS